MGAEKLFHELVKIDFPFPRFYHSMQHQRLWLSFHTMSKLGPTPFFLIRLGPTTLPIYLFPHHYVPLSSCHTFKSNMATSFSHGQTIVLLVKHTHFLFPTAGKNKFVCNSTDHYFVEYTILGKLKTLKLYKLTKTKM